MNKKSYILGILTGVALTFVFFFIIGITQNDSNQVQYFEQPVSYESKTIASFQVFQVLGEAALAKESSEISDMFLGNTVLLIGEDFYNGQIVTIRNPQRIGTYSYTSNSGMPMTVPAVLVK